MSFVKAMIARMKSGRLALSVALVIYFAAQFYIICEQHQQRVELLRLVKLMNPTMERVEPRCSDFMRGFNAFWGRRC